MNYFTAYLLVGEIPGVALWFWAAAFNYRFVSGRVRPRWFDVFWLTAAQLLWPIAVPVLIPLAIYIWRLAVQKQTCVCGHPFGEHLDGHGCTRQGRSAQWLVSGEGEEFFYCQCPKFTPPVVKR